MYLNLPGVLMGAALAIVGILLSMRVFNYYRNIQEPGKNLAKNSLISISLFTAGALGVVVDSLTEAKLWFI
ncbi:hypothetical protein DRN34_03585, partial [Thermococci archaeon]